MTFKQKLAYFGIAFGLLVVFAFIAFFGVGYIVNLVSGNWLVHVIVTIIFVLIINPLIVSFIMNKLPFKVEGLKAQDKINIKNRNVTNRKKTPN